MSDAFAQVFSPEGELFGYSVYHGSSDSIYPMRLNEEFTWEGRHDFFKEEEPEHEGDCWSRAEPCIVFSSYASGCYWAGLFCPVCWELLGPSSPWPMDLGYTESDPGTERFDGHPFPELNRTDLKADAVPPTEER